MSLTKRWRYLRRYPVPARIARPLFRARRGQRHCSLGLILSSDFHPPSSSIVLFITERHTTTSELLRISPTFNKNNEMPIAPSGSSSSDYFSDDSMDLVDALGDRVLPGDDGWNSQPSQNEENSGHILAAAIPLANAALQSIPPPKPPPTTHTNTKKTLIYDIPDPMYLRELPTGIPKPPPSLKRPRPEDFDEDLFRSTDFSKLISKPSPGSGRFEDGDLSVDDVNPPNPAAEAGVRMIQGGTGRYGFKQSDSTDGRKLEVYGAAKFDGLGDYMARRRAKLQIQNAHIPRGAQDGKATQSGEIPSDKIFKGIAIYVCLPTFSSAPAIDAWI